MRIPIRPHTGRSLVTVVAALMVAGLSACRDMNSAPDARDSQVVGDAIDAAAPSVDEVANASFDLGLATGPVKLSDGVWANAVSGRRVGLARDFRLIGDLDDDGHDETAALLADSTGANRTVFLSILQMRDGFAHARATAAVGTGVQLRDARLENRTVVLRVVRRTGSDPECCPSENAELTWGYLDGTLTLVDTKTAARTLSDLAGATWVLRAFDFADQAPAEPVVTLELKGDAFVGSGGCNRYTAAVESAAGAGELRVKGAASTRMACAPPASALEQRYLKALEHVSNWGFYLGQLALTWQEESGAAKTLLFTQGAPQGT